MICLLMVALILTCITGAIVIVFVINLITPIFLQLVIMFGGTGVMSIIVLSLFLTIYGIAGILISKAYNEIDFTLFGSERDNVAKEIHLGKSETCNIHKYEKQNECITCFDEPPNIKFVPCKHRVVCGRCYQKLSFFDTYHCIVCRRDIRGIIRIGRMSDSLIIYKKIIMELDYEQLLF